MPLTRWSFVSIVCLASIFADARAELVSRLDGQAVYDTDLDITWLADANVNGLMDWDTTVAWIASIQLGGFTDWRLPNMDRDGDGIIIDCHFGFEPCADNEYGYLWKYYAIAPTFPSPFLNVQSGIYWSETPFHNIADATWGNSFSSGGIGGFLHNADTFLYSWAVRDGDVLNPPPIQIAIDIKARKNTNKINLRSGGDITVAILTTSVGDGDVADFYALRVNAATLKFGPGQATISQAERVQDVDRDGDSDLLVRFDKGDAAIACGDTEAVLSGMTFGGSVINGSDQITAIGCD